MIRYNVALLSAAAPIAAFLLSWILHFALLSRWGRLLAIDVPNERSLHAVPTPRTGGIAIMLGSLVGLTSCPAATPIWGLALGLSALSFFDDRFGLSVAVRLFLHLTAAAAVALMATPDAHWGAILAAAICIGWMTNLYNFMDGSDGLAGGMAITGFLTYAYAAAASGQESWSLALLALAAAAAAFLRFNWPPARIFMGDSGSIPLGFLSAAIGMWGFARHWWPLWFPLVTFAPFVVDASATLIRRALRGDNLWRPHREHYYQRMILSGWSKRTLMWWWHIWMLTCAAWATATLGLSEQGRIASLCTFAGIQLLLLWFMDRRWNRFLAYTMKS